MPVPGSDKIRPAEGVAYSRLWSVLASRLRLIMERQYVVGSIKIALNRQLTQVFIVHALLIGWLIGVLLWSFDRCRVYL